MVEKHYTIGELSTLLGRSQRSIYRDIYSGAMKAAKVGGTWRVPETAVEAFVTGNGGSRYDMLRTTLMDARSSLTQAERMGLVQVLVGE